MHNFWAWFFRGVDQEKPGYFGLLDRWIILHAIVAFLGLCVPIDFTEQAKTVILPFSGVLIGITFACSGNTSSLLSTSELSRVAKSSGKGHYEYVFTIQRGILIIFATVMLWCLVAVSTLDTTIIKLVCYFMSSFAVRESWQIILFAQYLILARHVAAEAGAPRRRPTAAACQGRCRPGWPPRR